MTPFVAHKIYSHVEILILAGQSWAAVTTEGLLVYSLDTGLLFDPLDLTEEVTPEAVRLAISQRQFSVALAMSLRLCDWELVASVVETVPSADGRVSTTRALCLLFSPANV